MYKALILDDEERPIRVLLHCLKAYPEFKVVATCRDAPSTLSAVKAHRPDILFLDILVDGETIFPLLDELWDGDYAPAIVFVTAWGEKFLREAMERCGQLFQWSYLMKPVRDKKLATVIRRFRAVREQAGSEEKQLLMKAGGREFRLSFKEIVYCESDGNYVKLFQLRGGRLVRHILVGQFIALTERSVARPGFCADQLQTGHQP